MIHGNNKQINSTNNLNTNSTNNLNTNLSSNSLLSNLPATANFVPTYVRATKNNAIVANYSMYNENNMNNHNNNNKNQTQELRCQSFQRTLLLYSDQVLRLDEKKTKKNFVCVFVLLFCFVFESRFASLF